jgi:Raf kinase inhibitor-like YbhB/YbcL family protein
MTNARRSSSALAVVAAVAAVVAMLALGACSSASKSSTSTTIPTTSTTAGAPSIVVTSTAFANGERIPRANTCDAAGATPPVAWTGVPSNATSVALVVDDPDAPLAGGFVHWVVLGLPPRDGAVPPLPAGAREMPNGAGAPRWTPPCPPPGEVHHYRFTVYALDRDVTSAGALDGATIQKTTLVGTYSR